VGGSTQCFCGRSLYIPLLQHIAGKKEAEAEQQEVQEQERFFSSESKEVFEALLGFSATFQVVNFTVGESLKLVGGSSLSSSPLG
jgi:hypothetical protein